MPLYSNAGQKLIATSSPTGTGTVTFSDIPQTYTDLVLLVRGRATKAAASFDSVNIQFNGDTGTNYNYELDTSSGATPAAAEGLDQTSMQGGWLPAATAPAGTSGFTECEVFGYTGTTFHKAMRLRTGLRLSAVSGGMFVRDAAGWWSNTAAITSITVTVPGGNYETGTLVSLYGRI